VFHCLMSYHSKGSKAATGPPSSVLTQEHNIVLLSKDYCVAG